MTVQQVIDLAAGGELKTLAVRTDTNAVIGYINLGLIELYKRFTLELKEHIVELVDGQDIYTLPSDCMYIVAAYGEVDAELGEQTNQLPVNVEDNPLSVNTVSWKQVQIPLSSDNNYVSLVYVAAPTYVINAEETLELPPQLLEALLHYIGYRAHGSINGNVDGENNTHYQRFELSCQRVQQLGLLTADDLDMTAKLNKGGFL